MFPSKLVSLFLFLFVFSFFFSLNFPFFKKKVHLLTSSSMQLFYFVNDTQISLPVRLSMYLFNSDTNPRKERGTVEIGLAIKSRLIFRRNEDTMCLHVM